MVNNFLIKFFLVKLGAEFRPPESLFTDDIPRRNRQPPRRPEIRPISTPPPHVYIEPPIQGYIVRNPNGTQDIAIHAPYRNPNGPRAPPPNSPHG